MPTDTGAPWNIPYSQMDDPANDPTGSQAMAERIAGHLTTVNSATVMRFATKAIRDSTLVGPLAPKPGMMAYTDDDKFTRQYLTLGTWSGWAPLPGTNATALIQYSSENTNMVSMVWTSMKWSGGYIRTDFTPTFVAGSTKFQPIIPGRYIISGSVVFASNTTGIRCACVMVSGAQVPGTAVALNALAYTGTPSIPLHSTVVSLNGTTDYVEIQALHSAGVDLLSAGSNPYRCTLTAIYAGSA